MMRLLAVVTVMAVAGCRTLAPVSTVHMPLNGAVTSDPACQLPKIGEPEVQEHVSFLRLIARPELYDRKRIQVYGFVNLEFEGNALYLSEDLYRHGSAADAVWLELTGIAHAPLFRRGRAYVAGTFIAGPRGHMAMFSGTLCGITRLERDPTR